MVESKSGSRRQLVAGAADLIRRRGVGAASIREVAKHAKAPLGSTYHYFPGGKQQLATEAVRFAGDAIARKLEEKLRDGPLHGLRAFLDLWREVLTGTDFQAGCPVLAVAIEQPPSGESSTVHAAAAEAFSGWQSRLADSLGDSGVDAENAEQLAALVVAAVEGAVVMCRAHRSTKPLDHVAVQLDHLIAANLPR